MALIRVSQFCRPSKPAQVEVNAIVADTPKRKNFQHGQLFSIGWVSSNVLVALSAMECSFAWLHNGDRKILLRLYLSDDDEEENASEDLVTEDDFPLAIYISPIAGANLGLATEISTQTNQETNCRLEIIYEDPAPASHVVLQPLGRPSDWPRLHVQAQIDDFWIHPHSNTLLQQDTLLSVRDTKSNRICYYQVMKVTSENRPEAEFYLSSSSTTFEMVQPVHSKDYIRRLPPLLSQQYYCYSYSSSDPSQLVPPHPNLSHLMNAMQLSTNTTPTERILHVEGNDQDHDVCLAVETAAKQIGRTCWSLRGLAAFAHAAGRTVRNGSLVDQLAGLEAALEEIQEKRMEPVVLHLVDLDQELSVSDEPLRHDQEERIWSKLLQGLTSYRSSHQPPNKVPSNLYICPMIVVISSAAPFKPGPWLEKLVFPSIVLSMPDRVYTEYLWRNKLDVSVADLLRNRTTSEIRRIRQEVMQDDDPSLVESNMLLEERIKDMCTILDAKRRQKASASVSNVHWDDVGGLSHVRREIMDAIELPLKYPHLFPNTSGRSGILLYGPPGTGKTLVAKAVATECGLPFLSIKGPELLGSYVGESEANVRAVFQSAREAAEQNLPVTASILFFDELDSLAPRRGGVGDGGGVMERVVATLFAELDGDSSSAARIFVMGATNRPDLLDPSLLRPGRLDRLVYLGIATDPAERARILSAQLHKLRLDGDALDLSKAVVDKLPPRLTGADFSTIASGALLHAVRRLCRQADEEQRLRLNKSETNAEIEEILLDWGETKCTPLVCLEDLLEASNSVIPSVSQEELDRYERLRDQYSTNANTEPIEHDGDIFY